MSTYTKLVAFDKAIAELHSNRILQNRQTRLELGGEGPSLRTSNGSLFFNTPSSDNNSTYSSDSDSELGSNGSYGSAGNHRHSMISEEGSPVSLGASFAFMSSARGSRILQEEELVRLGDSPLDSSQLEHATSPQFSALGLGDRIRSSPIPGKDKRSEYFAKIKSEFLQGTAFPVPPTPLPAVPLPSSSPPAETDEWHGGIRRANRYSTIIGGGVDKDKETDKMKLDKDMLDTKEGDDKEKKDKEKTKENDKERIIKEKKKEKKDKEKSKEEKKEEKLKRKQEKKEHKMKLKNAQIERERERDSLSSPSPPLDSNPRIMQQLLGAMRSPRTSLSHRGGSVDFTTTDEYLRRPVETKESTLRRSSSYNVEPAEDGSWRQRPKKIEKILGSPVPDFMFPEEEKEKSSWRKTILKGIHSDPSPIPTPPSHSPSASPTLPPATAIMPPCMPPPPPPPVSTLSSESEFVDEPIKQRRVPKIYQILGENPSLASVYDIPMVEETSDQDRFAAEMDIDEEGIVFADQLGKRVVKGATLKKLVERITCESVSDTNFLLQFIITYRSFTNPHELLELLKARYETGIEIGADVCEAERDILNKKKHIVRLRVYNVIRQWMDKQWVDFMEDNTLVEKMLSYAPILNEAVSSNSNTIDKIMARKLAEGDKQKTIMFSEPPPKSYIPTVPKDRIQLQDIHSEEIARQMTLMEYSLFKAIKPWEYLSWNTKMKQTKSANILAMINKFNVMSKWVQREVLHSGDTPKQRAVVIGKFLEICQCLRTLKNFNGIMEILSGLNASAVHRLKLTWACLSSKQIEVFQDFNTFSSGPNYKNLRNALHTLQPPCIPYVGMYLTDLTFINDGIPLYLPESGLINFDKCRKVSASVQEIMQYQQTPFCLHPVEEIQTYLSQVEAKQTETDNDIYQLSLALEERK